MDHLLASKSLPPGFRFHPTDEELFMFYLKRKVMGKSLRPQMISVVDVYRFEPWDLPPKSCLKTRDLNWYFFCPRSQKYSHGGRTNRSTEHGYWKSTGNDRTIPYNNRTVGKIKTLIFHLGKAPKGERTDWVMHEYRLIDKVLEEKGVHQDAFVICKVYKKSGLGPKNGEDYGAPFMEEDWETDDDDKNVEEANGGLVANHHHGVVSNNGVNPNGEDQSASEITNAINSHGVVTNSTMSFSIEEQQTPSTSTVVIPAAPVEEEVAIDPLQMDANEIDRLLEMFREDDTLIEATKELPDNDIYMGLPDLDGSGYFASQIGFNWSQITADNVLELDDLNEKLLD